MRTMKNSIIIFFLQLAANLEIILRNKAALEKKSKIWRPSWILNGKQKDEMTSYFKIFSDIFPSFMNKVQKKKIFNLS